MNRFFQQQRNKGTRLFAFLIASFLCCFIGRATPVLFSLQDLTGLPKIDRCTLIVDATNNPYTDGLHLFGGATIALFPPTNGVLTTNLLPAGYTLSVPGWTHTVHFVVPLDTNTWNVVDLITNGLSGFPAVQFNYGMPIAAGANITIQNQNGTNVISSTGGSAGGIPALAGTNVFITLVSGSNQFNVPAGSFDAAGAAQSATNNLGSAAFTSGAAYDAANSAKSATNNLGTAAFAASSAFDAAGAARSATNSLMANGIIVTNNTAATVTLNGPTTVGGDLGGFFDAAGNWYLNQILHGTSSGDMAQIGTPYYLDPDGNLTSASLFINSAQNAGNNYGGLSVGDDYAPNGDWNLVSTNNGTLLFNRFGTPGNTNNGNKGSIDQVGNLNFRSSGTTILNASNLTGTLPLPVNVVTTFQANVNVGSGDISNSTYGDLFFQRNGAATAPGMDSFQGNLRLWVPANNSFQFELPGPFPTSYVSPFDNNASVMQWLLEGDAPIYNGMSAPRKYVTFQGYGDPQQQQGSGAASVSITDFGRHGGFGSALEGLPESPQTTGAAMPEPPFILTTFCSQGWNCNTNENQNTNLLAKAGVFYPFITNAGGVLFFHNDENAQFVSPHRDANGFLYINTNYYPDSSNYAAVVHGYGAKFEPTIYYYPLVTNEVDYWSQGVGSGLPAFPAMTPNSVHKDVSKFYDFGADDLRVSDIGNASTISMLDVLRQVAENIQSPYSLGGVQALEPFYLLKQKSSPLGLEVLTPATGTTPAEDFALANVVGHDNWNQGPGVLSGTNRMITWMSVWRAQYLLEEPYLTAGHYLESPGAFLNGDYPLGETRGQLALTAIGRLALQCSMSYTNPSFAAALPNFAAQVTNENFLALWLDPQGSKYFRLLDQGSTNISAWCKPTSGGGFAVMLANETGAFTNITFYLPLCLPNPALNYNVLDVWSNVSYTTAGNAATVTYTNVAPDSAALLWFMPTNYLAGNAVTNNSAAQSWSGPQVLTNVNNIISGNGSNLTSLSVSALATNGVAVVATNNVYCKIPWFVNAAGVQVYLLGFTNGP